MKTLKFKHQLAQLIAEGKRKSTWRVNDEKNLTVNDEVAVIDKVDRIDQSKWQKIGSLRINEVIQKRLGEITDDDLKEHDHATKQEMLKALRGYYGDKINESTPVKIIRFDFKAQKPVLYANMNLNPDSNLAELKLYADGGSRGNPGPSASGYVLTDMNGAVIVEGGLFLGVTTNNQAEYRSLLLGFEEAKKRSVLVVHVFMDSQLVINQMLGTYRVKNKDLLPVFQDVKNLASEFKKVTYTHVPREFNKLADAMVNEVLDSEPIDSR